MDEDEKVMREVQEKMFNLVLEYPDHNLQALGMMLRTVMDCYVASWGQESTEKILDVAVDSVKSGRHTFLLPEIDRKSLH